MKTDSNDWLLTENQKPDLYRVISLFKDNCTWLTTLNLDRDFQMAIFYFCLRMST